jgi:hypothetical protein
MGIDPNFRGGPWEGAGLPQQHKSTKAEGFFIEMAEEVFACEMGRRVLQLTNES